MDSRLSTAENRRIAALYTIPTESDWMDAWLETVRAIDPDEQIRVQDHVGYLGPELAGAGTVAIKGGTVLDEPMTRFVTTDRGPLEPEPRSMRKSVAPVANPSRFITAPNQRVILTRLSEGRYTRSDGREDAYEFR
jgi:hypothetical protein